MWGVPAHEELRRYRAAWYRWGLHDGLREPGLAWRKRDAGARATARAGDRAQVPVPNALRDLCHPRWTRRARRRGIDTSGVEQG